MRSAAPGASRNVVGQRRRPGRPFGQPAQLEEPEVGIGGLATATPRITGRSSLHDPRPAGEAGGELAHRGAGALDVGEAERGEALLGGFGRQGPGARRASRAAARRRGARGSSAPRAGAPGARPRTRSSAVRSGAVAVAEDPREPRSSACSSDGMSVRLLLVVELEAVLDGAQEPVRVGRGDRRRRRST